jgi:hypothetical protein
MELPRTNKISIVGVQNHTALGFERDEPRDALGTSFARVQVMLIADAMLLLISGARQLTSEQKWSKSV